ncbi:MAG: DUF885 domain-containing protein, partial [Candidatus Limnocylindria bacterium]
MTADLDRLAEEYWDAALAADPTEGTVLGDHRYGGALSDISDAGRAALIRRFEALRASVAALPAETDAEAALT